MDMTLGHHPVSSSFVWHNFIIIYWHFSNESSLGICTLLYLFILFISFDMPKSLFKSFFFSLQLNSEFILQRVLQEKSTSDWINSLLMHFFNVLHKGTKRDLVRGFNQTNSWYQELVSHFLDSPGDLPLDIGLQSSLISIIKLTCVVQKLDHHGHVFEIDILFGNSSHDLLPQFLSVKWSIDEDSRLLLIEFEKLLSPLNDFVISKVCVWVQDWGVVSIFLFVLPVWLIIVVPITVLVLFRVHWHRWIWTDVLS